MQAGKLDHRVTIQEKTVSGRTSKGAPEFTWTPLASVPEVWAGIRPLRGIALFAAQQEQSGYEVDIEIYYRSDIRADMRAVDSNGDIYDIKSIDTTDRRKGRMVLQCARGLNAG